MWTLVMCFIVIPYDTKILQLYGFIIHNRTVKVKSINVLSDYRQTVTIITIKLSCHTVVYKVTLEKLLYNHVVTSKLQGQL